MQALEEFRKYDVFSYLSDGFEVLHTQGRNYLMHDILEYIDSQKPDVKVNA
jgi:hypothetical protein